MAQRLSLLKAGWVSDPTTRMTLLGTEPHPTASDTSNAMAHAVRSIVHRRQTATPPNPHAVPPLSRQTILRRNADHKGPVAQLAEASDLKSLKCGFESRRGQSSLTLLICFWQSQPVTVTLRRNAGHASRRRPTGSMPDAAPRRSHQRRPAGTILMAEPASDEAGRRVWQGYQTSAAMLCLATAISDDVQCP